jgi:hypothetical protein
MISENQVAKILSSAGAKDSPLRPTELYNEGWMLSLILDWCSTNAKEIHPLYFLPGTRWASEGLMPTQFRARFQNDRLSESRTHADGIIGHFSIGSVGNGDVSLNKDAKQLIVVEAKMFSLLSAGTKNAADFDQAARNVACIVELLAQAKMPPDRLNPLAFYVVAPRVQIESDAFSQQLSPLSVKDKVGNRIKAYDGKKDKWFEEWFLPTMELIKIESLAWEDLAAIAGPEYLSFYDRCLQFNQPHSIAFAK